MPSVRVLLAAALAAVALAAAACSDEDEQAVRDEIQERRDALGAQADKLRERAERLRERAEKFPGEVAQRIEDALEDLRPAVPPASQPPPASEGRVEANAIDAFLTQVIRDVDRYWTRTLRAAGRELPQVRYVWVPPGQVARTACGVPADDNAAFYCTADDTIYVARVFAERLWRGIAEEFPGTRAGEGRAIGDFGVAYVVAHEYAHNVQFELGIYAVAPQASSKPFELMADCMAGLWANAVFEAGRVEEGDVQEALSTASAVGDFEFGAREHHGTPKERRAAWSAGYRSGDPSVCQRYSPART
jgi:uncharacterized protein